VKTYVLDANVAVSFLINTPGAEAAEVIFNEAGKGEAELFMSAMQIGEIYYTILRKGGAQEARRAVGVLEHIGVQILPLDQDRIIAAAQLKHETGLAIADAVAAATALGLNCQLVTSDKDFKRVEKKVKIHWV
jgi:predicted nucleic acid-binding protein